MKTKVFYSEEFYRRGRSVSLARANSQNSKLHTYGIQHGLLLRNHTTYIIPDTELNADGRHLNGMPIPDKFIVWGNYFKILFLSNNSLPGDYVTVAGNMKYATLDEKYNHSTEPGEIIKILWCTSMPKYFKAEYEIIFPVLGASSNYSITFRLHQTRHITEEDIHEWVDKKIMQNASISKETDVFKDISDHDMVICSSLSSIFLNSLILGKLTCRMISDIALADFTEYHVKNLYDIRSTTDFKKVLNDIRSKQKQNTDMLDVKEFCYTNKDVWESIIAE